jgi:hypothetical protein
MPLPLYILLFMVWAVIFEPVFFDFGHGFLESTCAYALSVLYGVINLSGWWIGTWIIVDLAIYLILFYLAARCTFWLSMLLKGRIAQITIQCLILLGFLAWTLRWKF